MAREAAAYLDMLCAAERRDRSEAILWKLSSRKVREM